MWVRLKIIAVLVLVGAVALTGAFQLGKYKQRQEGVIQQLQSDIRAERERLKDDAKTRNLSDYDFCIQSLRRRGVRTVGECEQLRGLAQE
jgi:type II secretory pathway pseudopilin PulG